MRQMLAAEGTSRTRPVNSDCINTLLDRLRLVAALLEGGDLGGHVEKEPPRSLPIPLHVAAAVQLLRSAAWIWRRRKCRLQLVLGICGALG